VKGCAYYNEIDPKAAVWLRELIMREGVKRLQEEAAAAIGDTVAVAKAFYIRTDVPLVVPLHGTRNEPLNERG
jgi:hypothetical protein